MEYGLFVSDGLLLVVVVVVMFIRRLPWKETRTVRFSSHWVDFGIEFASSGKPARSEGESLPVPAAPPCLLENNKKSPSLVVASSQRKAASLPRRTTTKVA